MPLLYQLAVDHGKEGIQRGKLTVDEVEDVPPGEPAEGAGAGLGELLEHDHGDVVEHLLSGLGIGVGWSACFAGWVGRGGWLVDVGERRGGSVGGWSIKGGVVGAVVFVCMDV